MPADPFSILGLERRFDLDTARIEHAYLTRIASLHPDLAGDPGADAARQAAALNDARRTLSNPEERARALLDAMAPDREPSEALPDGFLVEIMETRLELEAAAASGDPAQIARWMAWAAERRAEFIDRLAGLFRAGGGDPAALAGVPEVLNAWRYIERMIEQMPEST